MEKEETHVIEQNYEEFKNDDKVFSKKSESSEDTGSSIHSLNSDLDDISTLSDDSSDSSDIEVFSLGKFQATKHSSVNSVESPTLFENFCSNMNSNNSNLSRIESFESKENKSLDMNNSKISPKHTNTEKKKLTIGDSLLSYTATEIEDSSEINESTQKRPRSSVFQTIGRFFGRGRSANNQSTEETKQISNNTSPGSKITFKDGEREEHWEFTTGGSPNENNQKKVLKLETSSLNANEYDSDEESSSSLTDSVEDSLDTQLQDCDPDVDITNPLHNLHFEFRDKDKVQCREWKRLFKNYKRVQVQCESMFDGDLEYDAVIVPGNSFGFLDGEPEINYTIKFGWKLQDDLQSVIQDEYDGELLVGQAVIIPLHREEAEVENEDPCHRIQYAIYVPVMRVPLMVQDSINAYLALRAAIRAVKYHNLQHTEEETISMILCPSLCNGFGSMPAGRIAAQMKLAYDAFAMEKCDDITIPKSLGVMATNHVKMTTKIGNWC